MGHGYPQASGLKDLPLVVLMGGISYLWIAVFLFLFLIRVCKADVLQFISLPAQEHVG